MGKIYIYIYFFPHIFRKNVQKLFAGYANSSTKIHLMFGRMSCAPTVASVNEGHSILMYYYVTVNIFHNPPFDIYIIVWASVIA